MGKDEIIKILKEDGGWMTGKQVHAKDPGCNLQNTVKHLGMLAFSSYVYRDKRKLGNSPHKFKIKEE